MLRSYDLSSFQMKPTNGPVAEYSRFSVGLCCSTVYSSRTSTFVFGAAWPLTYFSLISALCCGVPFLLNIWFINPRYLKRNGRKWQQKYKFTSKKKCVQFKLSIVVFVWFCVHSPGMEKFQRMMKSRPMFPISTPLETFWMASWSWRLLPFRQANFWHGACMQAPKSR